MRSILQAVNGIQMKTLDSIHRIKGPEMMSLVSTMIHFLAMEEASQTLLFHSSISIVQLSATVDLFQRVVDFQLMNVVTDEL